MTHDALSRFNHTIDMWIGFLDEYSFGNLTKRPHSDSWSLGQVLLHIIEDTRYHVQQMRAATITDDNGEKEMHENAKWMFANDMFPDIKIEGAPGNDLIPQPASKEAIRNALTAIRKEVNDMYNSVDFSKLKGKSEHPGLWFFSATEWLTFTEMHMRHHLRQKKRIDEALKNT